MKHKGGKHKKSMKKHKKTMKHAKGGKKRYTRKMRYGGNGDEGDEDDEAALAEYNAKMQSEYHADENKFDDLVHPDDRFSTFLAENAEESSSDDNIPLTDDEPPQTPPPTYASSIKLKPKKLVCEIGNCNDVMIEMFNKKNIELILKFDETEKTIREANISEGLKNHFLTILKDFKQQARDVNDGLNSSDPKNVNEWIAIFDQIYAKSGKIIDNLKTGIYKTQYNILKSKEEIGSTIVKDKKKTQGILSKFFGKKILSDEELKTLIKQILPTLNVVTLIETVRKIKVTAKNGHKELTEKFVRDYLKIGTNKDYLLQYNTDHSEI